MSRNKPWVEPLKISPIEYEEWTTKVAQEDSVTFWALERGKLKAQEYLYWAREYYQLPVLKDAYFKQPGNIELWKQIKSVANWSPQMLPLDQYEGVVYVGCVEPPVDVQWSFPVIYVLTTSVGLKSRWNDYHSAEDIQAEPEIPITQETPVEPPTLEEAQFTSDLFDTKNILAEDKTLQAPEGMAGATGTDYKEDAAAPEGILVSMDSAMNPPPVNDTTESVDASPDGILFDMNATDSIESGDTPMEPDKVDTPKGMHIAKEELAKNDSKKFKLNFDMADDMEEPEASALHTMTKFSLTTTGLNKRAPKGAVIDANNLSPHTLTEAHSENQAIAWAFNELKQFFVHSQILLFNNNNLKPWKWENSWSPTDLKAFQEFDADSPGLFRIVKKTKQPYHGPVIESPSNTEFFDLWGYTPPPLHVTALPLDSDGHLIGVVLCIGEETANTNEALIGGERIVQELSQRLTQINSEAA